MIDGISRPIILALYQLSVLLGILLLPLAIIANHIGISLPFGRVIRLLHSRI